jgi:hypothetical protein
MKLAFLYYRRNLSRTSPRTTELPPKVLRLWRALLAMIADKVRPEVPDAIIPSQLAGDGLESIVLLFPGLEPFLNELLEESASSRTPKSSAESLSLLTCRPKKDRGDISQFQGRLTAVCSIHFISHGPACIVCRVRFCLRKSASKIIPVLPNVSTTLVLFST